MRAPLPQPSSRVLRRRYLPDSPPVRIMNQSILSAVALLIATTSALAQDDCATAIAVTNGSFGPYSNVGMTTSQPAWQCGLGANDVWFIYIAQGTGNVTVDTCGGSFDSTIEAFDGNGGCGALLSLGCNDDFCSLQSSISFPCTTGTTYYIRVGGYFGATGSFPLNINGPAGSGNGTIATVGRYGAGCYTRTASFYEDFANAVAFDLNSQSLSMLNTGAGYVVLPGISPWIAPSPSAIALPLLDDTDSSVPLLIPFPSAGGVATSLQVCSNGFVSTGPNNGTLFNPDVASMLSNVDNGFYCWHDFNPGISGSGQVMFEQVGAVAVVTWDGVWDYGGFSSADANTFQMQFDCASGNVSMVWQTMSANGGTGFLVGYSPGGSSIDPGSTDLSVNLGAAINLSTNDVLPLSMLTSARPVTGTSFQLVTNNVPAGAPIGATMLSFQPFNPGVDLGFLGAPGCAQYLNPWASVTSVITTPGSFSIPFSIPNDPSYVGLILSGQSAALVPGANALGALTSNGLTMNIGNL